MSLHPQPIPAIPEETVRVAHTILPQGNVYMQMRDELGTLYQDEDFRDLFPTRGQPAQEPWRLALVTIMQCAEGLTDRQAADAVRTRIDWKYALSLELTSPGFDFSVLSEFRSRLVANGAERRLFDLLLAHFRERGWIKARGKQRTDSTHVLAAIRTIRRLECVGETMRHARSAPGRSRARLAPGAHGPGVGRAVSEAFQRFSPAQRCYGTGGLGRNDWGRWSSALRTGICREQSSLVRGTGCPRNAATRLDTTLSCK